MNDPKTLSTLQLLIEAAQRHGLAVTGDGRVSEADAAKLLCLARGTLKNKRAEGSGPPFCRIPMNGCSLSYRLADLAAWSDSHR